MAGRPRKSDKEKRLRGTLQECRKEPRILSSDFELTTTPPCHLTKEAREAWAMAVSCAPKGHLTALDATVLERWARNYALYRKYSKALRADGPIIETDNGPRQNPLFNMVLNLQKVLASCEKRLGFTPISRARVRVAEEEEESDNAFEVF